ncbi:MAG: zinc-ribbon domain-containing protein [Deltaproteobacteria bacterium]|nr:zinc-ribbon domain-containing protein [Deltaproteobacteria bacterium]
MIVACPGCKARYEIEPERLRPEGIRMRCSRCEAVFRVSHPPATAESAGASPPATTPPVAMPQPEAAGVPAPSLPPPMSSPAPPSAPSAPIQGERLVLIADPEIEQGKSTASALAQWGLQPALVHDGVEAILAIQRLLPRAIVIDAALPKMFGFQICEIVKRNESLRDIHVVLVGAIHDRSRYRRQPEEIYGADAYIERQDLPESLRPILEGFGMLSSADPPPLAPAAASIPPAPPVAAPALTTVPAAVAIPEVEVPAAAAIPPAPPVAAPAPPVAAPAPTMAPAAEAFAKAEAPTTPETVESIGPTAPPAPQQTPKSVAPASPTAEDAGVAEQIEQAERLARIVVSDIVLYSNEKFEAAVQAGKVLEAMQSEIAEGRSLFAARVDPSIQEMRDFLSEELLRVAEAKGKP